MTTLVVLLRGHERSSLSSPILKQFIQKLESSFGSEHVKIHVHTWKRTEAEKSWRKNLTQSKYTNFQTIRDYFRCVEHITIQDENNIRLNGSTTGKIGAMPVLAWKRMWYGQYQGLQKISRMHSPHVIVLNMRIDYFTCTTFKKFNIGCNDIISKCHEALGNPNTFIFTHNSCEYDGIDNFFIAKLNNMKALLGHFNENLDYIQKKYDFLIFHEGMVFLEAHSMVNGPEDDIDKVDYTLSIIKNQLNVFNF